MATKTVFAALMGRANVGKSTLLNQLIGEKISIVSPKPQTTRTRVTGILTREETQFIFLDMPGFIQGKTGLGKRMEKTVTDSVDEAEIAVFIAEVKKPTASEIAVLTRLREAGTPIILVLNKIDLIPKERILEAIRAFSSIAAFSAVIPLSAKTGDGISILLDELEKYAEESPFFYDEDQISDQNRAVFVCEIVREKMLWLLGDEIPHGVALAIEQFDERKDLINVHVLIYCSRESHKGIIIGKNGKMLREISTRARKDLERSFGKRVFLQCFVKVKENWENNPGMLDALGFSIENG